MRIVVIEDNKTLAKGIAHQLRDQGHSVDIIHEGDSGLSFLLQERADISVLDINLPGMISSRDCEAEPISIVRAISSPM